MKQGDRVLVWGASGGLGSYAVQYVLNGGGTPVGVVSSPEKVDLLHDLGVEAVIDRKAAGYRFWKDEHTQDESEWRRFGKDIRALVGERPRHRLRAPRSPDHGRVGVRLQAGRRPIVTCAATSGYMIEYDNRHLWMKLKTIKGSHFANYREAWDANQLVCDGKVLPPLSARLPARPRSARPPTRCTTTCTRARSACCAWPPRRASASTTPSCGPRSARTASPCSGGTGHERRPGIACSPRSTTSAIAVRDLDAAIAYYRDTFGATVAHREVVELDGVEEALITVADSYIQLLTPDPRRLAGGQVPGDQGRGAAPRRLPGRRLRARP